MGAAIPEDNILGAFQILFRIKSQGDGFLMVVIHHANFFINTLKLDHDLGCAKGSVSTKTPFSNRVGFSPMSSKATSGDHQNGMNIFDQTPS